MKVRFFYYTIQNIRRGFVWEISESALSTVSRRFFAQAENNAGYVNCDKNLFLFNGARLTKRWMRQNDFQPRGAAPFWRSEKRNEIQERR